ncbi:hypothetical protein C1141_20490 [Vibrio agarivorans]|uniref:Uncharacterized protein n=1 Tax=Vibrio sagamiensis NBRC 104589 TaxID=1219064 RepID=A0A511QJM2_9VIBR|nr:hypothetical protein C1141_20490 [Vibrio agarivorans]GEM77524.1 hypothetical protein VSA01S_36360 [Vibrio sagamiensis NBRC 104589]
MGTIKELSKFSPLSTLIIQMSKRLEEKESASEIYRDLYPLLESALERGCTFESEEIQSIVSILERLPAWGAKRRNFKNRYLRNESTLRSLPRDPSYFNGQGMWH